MFTLIGVDYGNTHLLPNDGLGDKLNSDHPDGFKFREGKITVGHLILEDGREFFIEKEDDTDFCVHDFGLYPEDFSLDELKELSQADDFSVSYWELKDCEKGGKK